MEDHAFFGYGSLVNRLTHDNAVLGRATVRGWRRLWCCGPGRANAFLTVIPDPATAIEGLVAQVPDGDWQALDAREHAYARTRTPTRGLPRLATAAIYAIPPASRAPERADTPILLSYLDVVVQGYLREFGAPGAERFAATTDGWHLPVLNDRAAPRYPRAQQLEAEERAAVAHLLDAVRATVLEA
jgi:hypothetical protein